MRGKNSKKSKKEVIKTTGDAGSTSCGLDVTAEDVCITRAEKSPGRWPGGLHVKLL